MQPCVCTGVCVFYNIYFVQRGSCLFSACLHFVLLHVIIVVAAAVSLQRHRQTCVAVCLATFPPLPLSSVCVCVRVICSTVVCSLCKTWAHTPCRSRGSTTSTSCRTIFAFVTNFKWISLLSLSCSTSASLSLSLSLIFYVFAHGIRYVYVYVSLRFGRGLFGFGFGFGRGCIHMH